MSTEIIDEAAQYLNRDIIMTDAWWITWCYSNGKRQPDNYIDVPNFKQMNQCAIELVDNQKWILPYRELCRVYGSFWLV